MPLHRKMFLEEGGILTMWEIQETEEELLSKILLKDKEEELSTIKSYKSRLRWLASRLAIQCLFDDTAKRVDLRKDTHGKPYLTRCSGHISISHSGNMAAAIFHPHRCVGIDIEQMRSKIIDIDKKFLSSYELQFITKDKNRLGALFVCWCAKESVYKWYGRKGLSFKDSIAIQPFEYHQKGVIKAVINISGNLAFYIHYETIGDYMLAYLCI